MKKILKTAKIGRGRRPSPIWQSEEFFKSNYFKLDKLLIIKDSKTDQQGKYFSLRFAQHVTGQTLLHRFFASSSVLVLIILPHLE